MSILLQEEGMEKFTCRPVKKKTYSESREFFSSRLETDNLCALGIYITSKGTSERKIAGRIILSDFNPRNKSAELGYYMIPEYRNKGYMRKSLKILCEFMLIKKGFNKLYAQTAEFNHSSMALLESLNFNCDATLRKHHYFEGVFYNDKIFSLIKEDISS